MYCGKGNNTNQVNRHEVPRERFSLRISDLPPKQGVITLHSISVRYPGDDDDTLSNVHLCLHEHDRIGVIGLNGSGKTTLLRTICRSSPMTSTGVDIDGWVENSRSLRVILFEQNEQVERGKFSALSWFMRVHSETSERDARRVIGTFGITGKRQREPFEALSGGEKSRLRLATLAAWNPDVVLLDEPTNHMDRESIDGLITALEEFRGTVVVSSHNFDFLRRTCKKFIGCKDGRITEIEGTIDEYKSRLCEEIEASESFRGLRRFME